jgi:hypothetical protein
MTIGAGIAICGMWAATSFMAWAFRKDISPFGVCVLAGIAAWATTSAIGVKP